MSTGYGPAATVADVLAEIAGGLPRDRPLRQLTARQYRDMEFRSISAVVHLGEHLEAYKGAPVGPPKLRLAAEGGEMLVDPSTLRRTPAIRQPSRWPDPGSRRQW